MLESRLGELRQKEKRRVVEQELPWYSAMSFMWFGLWDQAKPNQHSSLRADKAKIKKALKKLSEE